MVRARELGLYFGPLPTGPFNGITDVPGVAVGHVSLISGQGKLRPGYGPVRTGVTAILPHPGNLYTQKCPAAVYAFNGYGKSTGALWVEELGLCENPIILTNSLSISAGLAGGVTWALRQNPGIGISQRTPNVLVLECDDSYLNDIRGRHLKPEHVLAAIAAAARGPVAEGNAGAGVGLSCFEFKGGIGTSSRRVRTKPGSWTVGILVQANFGKREDLVIKGVPVGEFLPAQAGGISGGSIISIVATDAPLDGRQLKRLAKRAVLGISRTGSISRHGSGDIVAAFSNFPWVHPKARVIMAEEAEFIEPLFKAVVEASEEAVLNALFQAETMLGRDDHVREKIPVAKVLNLLRRK